MELKKSLFFVTFISCIVGLGLAGEIIDLVGDCGKHSNSHCNLNIHIVQIRTMRASQEHPWWELGNEPQLDMSGLNALLRRHHTVVYGLMNHEAGNGQ